MITLTDEQISAIGAKVIPRAAPEPAKPSELTALLTEMKRFNSLMVQAATKEDTPDPAPVVSVAAPIVHLAPNINVSRPSTSFRVTVTQWALPPGSPPMSQMRIKELIIEPLE